MTRSRENGRFRHPAKALVGVLLIVFLTQGSWAAPNPVPDLINYQGLVYLANGSTDVTGTYDIEFRLYDHPRDSEGHLLWGEGLEDVQVANGRFNVILGNGTPIDGVPHGTLADAFRGDRVYIEFKLGADNTVKVRQRFVATPHAFSAQNAANAVHGVPPGTVMSFAGGSVPYGWLACDGASYSKSAYPALYAAICDAGVCIWGESGGNFDVPNFGGRTLAGANATHGVGVRRGAEKHALAVGELPTHSHTYLDKHWNGSNQSASNTNGAVANNSSGNTPRWSENTGSSTAHNNVQPSAVVNYIIKY
ncbi:MAG TPA: hypothetical protein HPP83_02550 [Candidatus Hydrogenedentes bacterium]|nr:hypothetical protein [Candidatus Hydrogenedentota bacterium]